MFLCHRVLPGSNGARRIHHARAPIRANQLFKMGRLLGWQLHYHPRKTPPIQGRQCNCHPNVTEN
jgi:hypothetical protein